jgi:hypothetical protein
MKTILTFSLSIILGMGWLSLPVKAYPPAVGITGNSPSCLACHISNGPWNDNADMIVDILDKDTKVSLKQQDGSFLIEVLKNQTRKVLTILGRKAGEKAEIPNRNAWLYVDQSIIGKTNFSTFPTGWEVNLPMACRLVGDKSDKYPGAALTVLPMSIRATDNAQNGTVMLQVMLTKGEAVKGKAKEGMIGNYYERQIHLVVK